MPMACWHVKHIWGLYVYWFSFVCSCSHCVWGGGGAFCVCVGGGVGWGRAWWVAQQSTYCNKWIHFLLCSLSVGLLSGCIARPKVSAMLRTGCLAHPEVAMHCNADSSGHAWMQGNWCCKMGSIVCRYCGYKYDAVTERAICSLSKLANPAIHHAIQPKQAQLHAQSTS